MAVCAAWEDITEDVVCASLCVEAPEKAFWEWCKIFSTFVEFPKALQRPASPKHSWRRGGMGDVRCDAFAPRISFVRCPRKWDKNANWETRTDYAGACGAIDSSEKAASADTPRQNVDGRQVKDAMEDWMRRSNLRRAPVAHYLDVCVLRALFIEDRDANSGEDGGEASMMSSSQNTKESLELNVFSSLFGIVLSQKFEGEAKIIKRRGFIGVTCDTQAASPLPDPKQMTRFDRLKIAETAEETVTRKQAAAKASTLKKEIKKKLDPNRSRNFSKETQSTQNSHSRYVTELLTLTSGPELLRLRIFPDAKELTESFAAHNAARTYLYPRDDFGGAKVKSAVDPADHSVTLIAIGDGTTPRTAALFAFLTKWQCVAIDPMMVPWETWRKQKRIDDEAHEKTKNEKQRNSNDGEWGGIHRLNAYRKKIQETRFECEKAVLVMVHAHVSLTECLSQVKTRSGTCSAVILPCCNWFGKLNHPRGDAPIAEYDDENVSSPQRLVRVFDDLPCGVLEERDTKAGGEMKEMTMRENVLCPEV